MVLDKCAWPQHYTIDARMEGTVLQQHVNVKPWDPGI